MAFGCSATNPAYQREAGSKGGSGDGTGDSATVSATGAGSGASMGETEGGAGATTDPSLTDGADGVASTGEDGCDCDDAEICTPDGCFGAQVFLHFEGPMMTVGTEDDARTNTTALMEYGGRMAPFGGGPEMRDGLLDSVRVRFEDLSVWITDVRPTEGNYTMVVLGDNLLGDNVEITPFDCDDQNANSVVFAGVWANDPLTRNEQALVVSHGIGHSFGLAHVLPSDSIMAASIDEPETSRFRDECLDLANAPVCEAHTEWCDMSRQNSWAQLDGVFSPG